MANYTRLLNATIIVLCISVSSAFAGKGDSLTKEEQLKFVKEYTGNIKEITNPDKDVQLAAVRSNGYAIRYIINPDKDVQLAAVQQWNGGLSAIINPDREIQLAAVRSNGYAISSIANPDKELQLAAVRSNGYAISSIANPDKDVQLAAVQQDDGVFTYIKEPDKEVQFYLVKKNPALIGMIWYPDEEVQLYIVQNFPKFSDLIHNPSKKVGYIIHGIKINTRPDKYLITDKTISIRVEDGNKLKITNLTNDFINIVSLAEYYGENIYSQESFSVPPQGVSTKQLRVPETIQFKSLDDELLYGFAVQYSLPNNSKQFSFFKTNKYKVSDLIGE